MAFRNVLTRTFLQGENRIKTIEILEAQGQGPAVDVVVPAGAVDQEVAWPCPLKSLAALAMDVSFDPGPREEGIPVKVDDADHFPTLTLFCDTAVLWSRKTLMPLPFSGDVLRLFVSNPTDEDVRLRIVSAYDPAPAK